MGSVQLSLFSRNPLRSRTPVTSGIVTTEAAAVMNFVEMALALRRGSGQPIPLRSKVGAKATHPRQTAPMRGRWKLPLPLQKPDLSVQLSLFSRNPLRSRTPVTSGIVTAEAAAVLNFVEMALALRRGSGQPIPLRSKGGAKATHPR